MYRSERSWTQLRRDAGRETPEATDAELEARSLKALGRLTHVDDPERVAFYSDVLEPTRRRGWRISTNAAAAYLTMLAWGLGSGGSGAGRLAGLLRPLWRETAVRQELARAADGARRPIADPLAAVCSGPPRYR